MVKTRGNVRRMVVTCGLSLALVAASSGEFHVQASSIYPVKQATDTSWVTQTKEVKKREVLKVLADNIVKSNESTTPQGSTETAPKEQEIKRNYEEFRGVYTPTVDLHILTEPWGQVQATIAPGHELEASRSVDDGDVTWVEVTYQFNSATVTGWASLNYLQTSEDYEQGVAQQKAQQEEAKQQQEVLAEQVAETVTPPEAQVQPSVEEQQPVVQFQYAPNHIYYNGTSRPYQNGGYDQGQAIIDGTQNASTWGGAQVFSGTDGLSTHFIGHSHTQFAGLTGASTYIITDSVGNAFQYNKGATYLVDEQGYDVNSGEDLYNLITGSGGGERVIMQTTQVHPLKWIYVGNFVGQVN